MIGGALVQRPFFMILPAFSGTAVVASGVSDGAQKKSASTPQSPITNHRSFGDGESEGGSIGFLAREGHLSLQVALAEQLDAVGADASSFGCLGAE